METKAVTNQNCNGSGDLDVDDPRHPAKRILTAEKQLGFALERLDEDDAALKRHAEQAHDALEKALDLIAHREDAVGRDGTVDSGGDQ